MPGAGPIIERVWDFVRSNPQMVSDMLRAAKDRFGSPSSPRPAGPLREPDAAPGGPDPISARFDQIDSDMESVGTLLGGMEARLSEFTARLNGIDGRIDRSEAELVRLVQASRQLARRLMLASAILGTALLIALGLLIYLSVR